MPDRRPKLRVAATAGAASGSDAFFPFRDNVDEAAKLVAVAVGLDHRNGEIAVGNEDAESVVVGPRELAEHERVKPV